MEWALNVGWCGTVAAGIAFVVAYMQELGLLDTVDCMLSALLTLRIGDVQRFAKSLQHEDCRVENQSLLNNEPFICSVSY